MRSRILASVVLAVVWGGGVPAARCWDFGAGIAATYDDNILNYSERDLFAFQYRLNPARFALETTDDLILAEYVEVAWEPESTTSTTVLGRMVANRYVKNTIRNNIEVLLQARTRLSRRWRLTVEGTYLPSYYQRQYIDYDLVVPYPALPRYGKAEYRQTEGAATLEWRPRRSWRGQLGYEYRGRDYLHAFPERDEDLHTLRLSVRPPGVGRFGARIRGAYGRGLARGRELGGAGGRPDVSTRRYGTGLTLEWAARSPLPSITAQQALYFENRRYTTSDELDTQRFGRSIHETDIEWELALGLSSQWKLTGGYSIDLQRLTGELSNVQTFTDAGSYNRHRVSLSLDWTSRQRRTRARETE